MRPLVRRKHPLRESEFGERAHLGNALLRGHARIRWLFGVACRGDIAERQTCVIVRRSDQSIEVGFKRSEEHTSELQSLMRISYAVFCLKKKKKKKLHQCNQ